MWHTEYKSRIQKYSSRIIGIVNVYWVIKRSFAVKCNLHVHEFPVQFVLISRIDFYDTLHIIKSSSLLHIHSPTIHASFYKRTTHKFIILAHEAFKFICLDPFRIQSESALNLNIFSKLSSYQLITIFSKNYCKLCSECICCKLHRHLKHISLSIKKYIIWINSKSLIRYSQKMHVLIRFLEAKSFSISKIFL